MKGLRISCQRDGFWRCGKQHFREAQIHPPETFTEEQVQRLKDEPMLHVVEVDMPEETATEPEGDDDKKSGKKKGK